MHGYHNLLVVRPEQEDVHLTVNGQRVVLTPARVRELCYLLQWALGVVEAERHVAAFLEERVGTDPGVTHAMLGEWKSTRQAQRILRIAKHVDQTAPAARGTDRPGVKSGSVGGGASPARVVLCRYDKFATPRHRLIRVLHDRTLSALWPRVPRSASKRRWIEHESHPATLDGFPCRPAS